jgi:hypothetical protein
LSVTPRRVSSLATVRIVGPIDDIIANAGRFFEMVSVALRTGDRMEILRFSNDKFEAVVEAMPEVIVDVDRGRVKLYPTAPAVATGQAAEEGWVLDEEEGGVVVLRLDGVTRERFASRDEATWWLAERSIAAREAA